MLGLKLNHVGKRGQWVQDILLRMFQSTDCYMFTGFLTAVYHKNAPIYTLGLNINFDFQEIDNCWYFNTHDKHPG